VGALVTFERAIVPGGTPGEPGSIRAADGTELRFRRFAPANGAARGAIVHLHGIQSHSGWYVETAAELARRGYAVYLADRRGSGLSAEHRGDFAHTGQLVSDVARLVEEARADAGGRPPVLVGGCWGARPAVAFAAGAPERIAALVLVAPALKAKVDLEPARKLQVFAGRMLRPGTRVPIPLASELFTENPPYLDFVRNDPLSLHDVTARFFFMQFFWDRRLLARRALQVPLLLMQSSPDPVVDVAAVREWYDGLEAPRKNYVRYEGFGHILDFAPERERFWNDLTAWVDEVAA
jgi:alpha-beta hydrolase superfamily lysophospholipase